MLIFEKKCSNRLKKNKFRDVLLNLNKRHKSCETVAALYNEQVTSLNVCYRERCIS